MVNETNETARIDRMVAAGTLTEEEGARLRAVIEDQQRRDTASRLRAAAEARRARRRIWVISGLVAVVFVLGLAGGWLFGGDAGVGAGAPPASVSQGDAEPPDGRLIDLSSLDKERRDTMNKTTTLSTVVILLLIAVLLGGGYLLLYNGLVTGRERVNAGWAQVENVYQRRLDLVPLLVDAVRTYTDHERETLTELTEARAHAIDVGRMLGDETPQTVEQLKAIEASQGRVESALARLLAVVENYPDLKASRNFLALQDQIEGTENRIAVERRNYNEFARRYNTRIQTFPGNIVADTSGFASKPYFEADSEALQGLEDPFERDSQ